MGRKPKADKYHNPMIYFAYILECQNGAYYTGYTTNIERRYQEHVSGQGSKYTRSFPPQCLAACWQMDCELSAVLKVENAIKSLQRPAKETLIEQPEYLTSLLRKKGFDGAPACSIYTTTRLISE